MKSRERECTLGNVRGVEVGKTCILVHADLHRHFISLKSKAVSSLLPGPKVQREVLAACRLHAS